MRWRSSWLKATLACTLHSKRTAQFSSSNIARSGIAKANGVDRSYVGRMLQLTSPAPDIVESILAGQAFADISLQHCRKGIPVFWEEQRRVLKSTAAHDLEAVANQ